MEIESELVGAIIATYAIGGVGLVLLIILRALVFAPERVCAWR